jgi:hypothetical protein
VLRSWRHCSVVHSEPRGTPCRRPKRKVSRSGGAIEPCLTCRLYAKKERRPRPGYGLGSGAPRCDQGNIRLTKLHCLHLLRLWVLSKPRISLPELLLSAVGNGQLPVRFARQPWLHHAEEEQAGLSRSRRTPADQTEDAPASSTKTTLPRFLTLHNLRQHPWQVPLRTLKPLHIGAFSTFVPRYFHDG